MQRPVFDDSNSDENCGQAEFVDRLRVEIDAVADPADSESVPRTSAAAGEQSIEIISFRVSASIGDGLHVIGGQLLIDANETPEHEDVLQILRNAHRSSLKQLFKRLSPPPLQSLVGEYDAELLHQGGPICNAVMKSMFRMHGAWLGKAFYPLGRSVGAGYNLFRSRGSIIHKLPMDTTIAKSALDDRHSLRISYDAKNRGLIRGLTGEVRQVTTNVLLGIGMYGPRLGRHDIWRRKIPFLLIGPQRSLSGP